MISGEIVPSSFRNALPMSRNRTFEPSSSLAIFVIHATAELLADRRDPASRRGGRRPAGGSWSWAAGSAAPATMAVMPWAISSAVALSGVIRADHEHDHLGLDAVELAVLDSPEDVLGPVAADAEIGRVPGPVEPLPDLVIIPPLGDRIAEEEQVDRPPAWILRRRLRPIDEPWCISIHGPSRGLGTTVSGPWHRPAGRSRAGRPPRLRET